MKMLYFGCRNDEIGHYLWEPDGTPASDPGMRLAHAVDGVHAPEIAEEPEGLVKFVQTGHMTIIAWWDRSVDKRHGSNVAFIAMGIYSYEEVMREAKNLFSYVFKRFNYELVRWEGE